MRYSLNICSWSILSLAMSCFMPVQPACGADKLPVNLIKVPPGFSVSVYADNVPGARSMALSPAGTLFVGTRQEGKVYALVDHKKENRADEVIVIASGLTLPNGVAFRNGSLYVAEVNRVLRFDNIEARLKNPPKPVVINESLPKKTQHGWKFIRFGPDGKLYVPVGAPCNVCESKDPRFATIMRMNADGTGLEIFARGVRNTGRFRLEPADARTLVYRQRARLDGGQYASGRAEPGTGPGTPFRLPVLAWEEHSGSGLHSGKQGNGLHFPGNGAGTACGCARYEVLYGSHVPARIPQHHIHGRAWLVEPKRADRLPDYHGARGRE